MEESQDLLTDLDEVMCLPEMEPFLTYLTVDIISINNDQAMRAVVIEHLGGDEDQSVAVHSSVVVRVL